MTGLVGEVSWDLVMEPDMPFAEGTYRVTEGGWQVFTTFRSRGDRPVGVRAVRWDSGVQGVNITFADHGLINKNTVLIALSKETGVREWREVSGPDSMQLR